MAKTTPSAGQPNVPGHPVGIRDGYVIEEQIPVADLPGRFPDDADRRAYASSLLGDTLKEGKST